MGYFNNYLGWIFHSFVFCLFFACDEFLDAPLVSAASNGRPDLITNADLLPIFIVDLGGHFDKLGGEWLE